MPSKWALTCTVPKHPKYCPDCKARGKTSRVRIYHLNMEKDAIFMCEDTQTCVWPLMTHSPEDILGKSDYKEFARMELEKKKVKGLGQAERKSSVQTNAVTESTDSSIVSSSSFGFEVSNLTDEKEEVGDDRQQAIQKLDDAAVVVDQQHISQEIASQNCKEIIQTENTSSDSSGNVRSEPVNPKPQSEGSVPNTEETEAEDVGSNPEDINDDHDDVDDDHLDADEPVADDPTVDEDGFVLPEPPVARSMSERSTADNDDSLDFDFSFRLPSLVSPMSPASIPSSPARSDGFKSPGRDAFHGFRSPAPHQSPMQRLRSDFTLGFRSPAKKETEFTRPSPNPYSNRTPIHIPDLLSPMPATPRRDEFSDSESEPGGQTPRTDRGYWTPQRPDVPALLSPMSEHGKQDGPMRTPPIVLKKSGGDLWSASSESNTAAGSEKPSAPSSTPQQQSKKIDKVVLNLKKTVGTRNCWNVMNNAEVSSDDLPPPPTPPSEQQPKARRGRKSKTAPKKIQAPPATMEKVEEKDNEELVLPTQGQAQNSEEEPVVHKPPSPKVQVMKTFSRKKSLPPPPTKEPSTDASEPSEAEDQPEEEPPPPPPEGATLLPSLSNRLFMSLGKQITVHAMPEVPADTSQIDLPAPSKPIVTSTTTSKKDRKKQLKEIAQLSNEISLYSTEAPPEFRDLMKVGIGGDSNSVEMLHKIQKTLNMDETPNEVTFHVGISKPSIDLPSQTLEVGQSDNTKVRVLLTSDSDGIEKDALRDSPLRLPFRPRPRGRPQRRSPPRPTRLPSPPTMVPAYNQFVPPPAHISPPEPPRPFEPPPPPAGMESFIQNETAVSTFKFHLQLLMQDFVMPDVWVEQQIDPVIAMMVWRKQDPLYQNINFDAMIQIYAKLSQYERAQELAQLDYSRQLQQYELRLQQYRQQEQGIDTSLTYAELQPVIGQTDASSVLRQIQQQQLPFQVPSADRAKSPTSKRTPDAGIKREVMEEEEFTPVNSSSVMPLSVRPAPQSVQEVPAHLHGTKRGQVGSGLQVVSLTYGKSQIGPIHVETDEEVRLVVALVKEKISEKSARGTNQKPQYSSAAVRARSTLKPEIIQYIDRCFTKKGLKESVIGRKKKNYPKRSQVIKQCPITKQLIYPPGHPQAPTVKEEITEECPVTLPKKAPTKKAASSTTINLNIPPPSPYNPPTPVIQREASNILNIIEPPSPKSPAKSPRTPMKVSTGFLFSRIKQSPKQPKLSPSSNGIDLEPSSKSADTSSTQLMPSLPFDELDGRLSMPSASYFYSAPSFHVSSSSAVQSKRSRNTTSTSATKKPNEGSPLITSTVSSEASDTDTGEPISTKEQFQPLSKTAPEVRQQRIKKMAAKVVNVTPTSPVKTPANKPSPKKRRLTIEEHSVKPTHSHLTRFGAAQTAQPAQPQTSSSGLFVPSDYPQPAKELKHVPTTPMSYVRPNKEAMVAKLLKRQEKKMEKKMARRQRKTYSGFGGTKNVNSDKDQDPLKHLNFQRGALSIDGKLKVLTKSGEVKEISVPQRLKSTTPAVMNEPADKRPQKKHYHHADTDISQKERDLINELLVIGSEAIEKYNEKSSSTTKLTANHQEEISEFELTHTLPENSSSVPSLEDLL